ncbi:unnamed protein product [Blepharisma stoltei]|uniref:Uncharacterized protein n=1 Tax=Blepharisma stoltei TaxID=1481888 RepID=A0AAU9J2N3_9CILI|nr:unnamed protein product [Blepharisma stoltei]
MQTDQMHFLKLLELASKNNIITLLIPNTIIYGFGFNSLTLIKNNERSLEFKRITEEQFKENLQFIGEDDSEFPFAVFKTNFKLNLAMTKEDAFNIGKSFMKDNISFSLQTFIVCPNTNAQIVRVQWSKCNGFFAKVIRNQFPYTQKSISKKVLSKAYLSDDFQNIFEKYDIIESSFLIVQKIISKPAKLSQGTIVLAHQINFIKVLLEESILNSTKLIKISGDFIQDENENWYFLNIHSYATAPILRNNATIRPTTAISEPFHSRMPSSPGCQTIGYYSSCGSPKTVCDKYQRTFDFRSTRDKIYTPNSRKCSYSAIKSPLRPLNFIKNLDNEARLLEKKLEHDVNDLIDKDKIKPLKFMTYKKWIKRRDDRLPDQPLERLFAERISSNKNIMQRRYNKGIKNLKNMVQSMNNIVMNNVFSGEYMAKQVAKMLLQKLYKLPGGRLISNKRKTRFVAHRAQKGLARLAELCAEEELETVNTKFEQLQKIVLRSKERRRLTELDTNNSNE